MSLQSLARTFLPRIVAELCCTAIAHPENFVTVQPLRAWQDRIADKCPAEYFQHAVALLPKRV
jgi:hypothetical protein